MDPAQGRGWAVVKGDELHGMIFFHGGDDSEFVARRAMGQKRPTRKKGRRWGMDAATEGSGYWHTQKAPLCLVLCGSALACFVLAGVLPPIPGVPGTIIAAAVGLLFAMLAPAFHHLTVKDEGDRLTIRFGPLLLFRRTVQYADIERVEVGRTPLLDGCGGIHYSIRGGWVWNLWGRDCIVVHLKKGGVLRIGTDDSLNLASLVEPKIAQQGA
jgi:hypothetical protein